MLGLCNQQFKTGVIMNQIFLKAILGSALILGAHGIAHAAPISCSTGIYDVSNLVEGSSACQRLAVPLDGHSANDDNDLINGAAFFGIDSWSREGKYDNMGNSGGQDLSALFNFTGNNQSGTFSYVGNAPHPGSIMLIFKDGNDTNLVAYLLENPYGTGLKYASPFIPGLFDVRNTRGISHISVYVSEEGEGGSTEVPEPGSLAIIPPVSE